MSDDETQRWENFSLGMTKMWERSIKLRREAEAKGPMKYVYGIHCHLGSIEWLEDAEGVFWVDADGDFKKVKDETPDAFEHMRSKGVPEETIERVVKQCEDAKNK